MVATQKIHVGMIHVRKAVTVTAEGDSFTIAADGETVAVVPPNNHPRNSTATSSTRRANI